MQRYETLLLVKTEISEDDLSMIERQIDQVVSSAEGVMETFDKWGKYRLAYPVRKNTHGIYALTRYKLPATQASRILKEINQFIKIKCNDLIMRHVTAVLRADAPISYAKPDPIDVSRGGSFDSYLKEGGKIESLLSSVDTAKAGRMNDMEESHHDALSSNDEQE
ncbi:MAG: 30S ribosomal protein S6 [Candidatus Babeliales bacterium]|jgi:small subunit ribosomal protein S6